MYHLGVSKTYSNGHKRRDKYTKKHYWKHYFYDENGYMHCKRVSWLKAFWFKLTKKKVKQKNIKCKVCSNRFHIVGNGYTNCPFCNTNPETLIN